MTRHLSKDGKTTLCGSQCHSAVVVSEVSDTSCYKCLLVVIAEMSSCKMCHWNTSPEMGIDLHCTICDGTNHFKMREFVTDKNGFRVRKRHDK